MTDKLATQTKGSLAVVPDHLKGFVGVQDAENEVTNQDMLIPRLSVAQAGMSPQLKKQHELYIPGLAEGQLFNTVTNEVYGDEAMVIPLFFSKNYIAFEPGGTLKVLAVYKTLADVPEGGLSWSTDDEGKRVAPPVTEFKNRMCLVRTVDDQWQPIVVSFKKGEVKFSDQWNSQIKFARLADKLPCFAHTYVVKPKLKQEGSKSWYVKTISPSGFTPQEIVQEAAAYFEQLQRGGYTVDTSGIEAEKEDVSFDGGKF
jgi:hypothetical protein